MFEKYGGEGKVSTFKISKVLEILENKMGNTGVCVIRLITVSILGTVFVIILSKPTVWKKKMERIKY